MENERLPRTREEQLLHDIFGKPLPEDLNDPEYQLDEEEDKE